MKKLAIGLMSGTSLDGVDAALVKISGSGLKTKVQLVEFKTYPYPKKIREMVLAASTPEKGTVDLICHLNFKLGKIFADAVFNILEKANFKTSDVSFIGSHGQTIYHLPEGHSKFNDKTSSTLQIGEPAVIAEKTGIKTVADFRVQDIAAGGLGAPLAPYAHFLLFHEKEKSKIVHNIGGISNLTFLPKNNMIDKVIAFDTGPGNMLIDGLLFYLTKGEKLFDKDGKWAAKGKINNGLLDFMMSHPFIKKPPPKTTGREEFGEVFLHKILSKAEKQNISTDDLVATITTFTAESIIFNYKKYVFKTHSPSEIIFCGGGAHNNHLMKIIKNKLPEITISTTERPGAVANKDKIYPKIAKKLRPKNTVLQVCSTEKYGIPSDAIEAVSFAILANETIHGNYSNLPSVTGAKRKVILGKIIPGHDGHKKI